ncbi:hypothetical protein SAMN04487949_2473 [Halogranum gelatinilyticum]|uniref:Uncharacterized protein n=1 Tax=Halogranum gelatinilyticum TaxID=660521 RepID=A0A1G9VR85_9EURY|nr:hypothetical protein [Halogranum gelatinilyticum]SDM74596.1 hypothetical protein SAMN04487949_2473 [Halogranum gelatinilyticum]
MNVPRLYRVALAVVGASLAANGLDTLRTSGLSVPTVVVIVGGSFLAVTSLLVRDPDEHGIPTEPGWQLYLVLLAAVLTVVGLALTLA